MSKAYILHILIPANVSPSNRLFYSCLASRYSIALSSNLDISILVLSESFLV